jgi:hypothetical protein
MKLGSSAEDSGIVVKMMSRMPPDYVGYRLKRQLPGDEAKWGHCRFVFDVSERSYDWLVVYHDLYRPRGAMSIEPLACAREKTVLVTTEPSTITVYGTDYLRQFGTVITSQEPWVISHPNPVFTQPGLMWFYGFPNDDGHVRTYDEMHAAQPPLKSRVISTVCSDRKGKLTLHYERFQFTQRLKASLPELDIFGHGIKPMSDKAEALDPYWYHIAIENHVYPHHLTEKLSDAFLGYTLPFYHGCPNAADYFPPESFIPIDIQNLKKSEAIIRSTITQNEYPDRLPYIIEARRRVLEEYNLFAVLDRYISQNDDRLSGCTPTNSNELIMNRQTIRIKKPFVGIRSLAEKAAVKAHHAFRRLVPLPTKR